MSHQHSHSHDHDHDHAHDDEPSAYPASDPTPTNLQHASIDFSHITCLNESVPGSARKIIEKAWPNRLDTETYLLSDADEQLIIYIPFTASIRLHSILLRSTTTPATSCPSTLRIWHNLRDGEIDFSSASIRTPTQTLDVGLTNDVQELSIKRTSFGANVYSLTIFVQATHPGMAAVASDSDNDNDSRAQARLFYLAFKGDATRVNREAVEVLYEKAANPKDHKLASGVGVLGGSRLGM